MPVATKKNKKQKTIKIGNKSFNLFPKPLRGIVVKCRRTGETINNIPVVLDSKTVPKNNIYVGPLVGLSLSVHGIDAAACSELNPDSIIAIAGESMSQPTAAVKIKFIRGFEHLMTNISR